MDYSKVLVKGGVRDLVAMFPSGIGERLVEKNVRVSRGFPTSRWRLVCEDGILDNVQLGGGTDTFIYHGGDRYRRGVAENEEGLAIDIGFRDTKHNKGVYNTNAHRMPFSWLRPRMKGAILQQFRYTTPDETYTTIKLTERRFVPTKVLYVGISSTMERHPERHGRMTIISTATISPTKSDKTPIALPVEAYPHVSLDADYRCFKVEDTFKDLTSSHVLYGVEHLKFVLGDGTNVLVERFGGYGAHNKPTMLRFFNECQTTLAACEFNATFNNEKEHDESHASRFHYICPLVVLPDMTEREGQTPLPCPLLQAERERRGAFKQELAEYVFNPERMFRLHGETFVDVLADCY